VHVLLAADAAWIVDELTAAIGDPETSFVVCTEGREVARAVKERGPFDVAVLDLQIGSMGGMAVTMSLRLDESSGLLPHVAVLMLLDRVADVHLAKRSGADGWLVKPLDPLRIRRAVRSVTSGERYREGLVVEARTVADAESADVVPAPSR
jgi:DNA-binding response OmpR family regulator